MEIDIPENAEVQGTKLNLKDGEILVVLVTPTKIINQVYSLEKESETVAYHTPDISTKINGENS